MNTLILMCILLHLFSEFISANDIQAENFALEEENFEVEERIHGGSRAKQGQFPWVVAIISDSGSCTGFVADKKTIITAAHCIQEKGKGNYTVYAGNISVKKSTNITIRSAERHPQYDNTTSTPSKYDVGILVTEQDIQFGNNLKAICIEGETTSHNKSRVTTMGFGLTKDCSDSKKISISSDILMYQDQKIIDEDEYQINVEGQGTSVCSGDSGGPLVYKSGNTSVAIGIASTSSLGYGNDTYSRISSFEDFIKGYAKEASFC